MSRFNCSDCVIFKTDACIYGSSHSDLIDCCKHILVDPEYAYNKAIDDFTNLMNEMPTCYDEVGSIRLMTIEEMAEQLKEGVRT